MFRKRSLTAGIRIAFGLIKLFGVAFGVALRNPRAIFFITYPGYFDVPIVWAATRFRRSKIVYDPFISLYDTAVCDRQLVTPDSWLGQVLLRVDRLALRMSTHVIADSPEHGQFYAELAGLSDTKISVVWLGADEEIFSPAGPVDPDDRLSLLRQVGLPNERMNEIIVLFYGTFVPLQGVTTIVETAACLDGVATFLLVGEGQSKVDAVDLARDRGIGDCFFLDRLAQGDLVKLMAATDVTLGIFGFSEKAGRVIPNKVFEAMACGSDVITARTPATERNLQTPILVEPQAESIAAAIREVGSNGGYRKRLHDTRGEYERCFSERQRRLALRKVLHQVAQNKP